MPADRWLMAALAVILIGAATPAQAASQEYRVADFERIYISGDARVELHQDTAAGVALAEGAPHRLEDLSLESSDGVLYIDAGDVGNADNLVIRVAVGPLKEIVHEGRGTVAGEGLRAEALAVEGHGAGQIRLQGLRVDDLVVVGVGATRFAMSGEARHQVVELSGQGSYEASALATETSQIDVRGTCIVELWVEELLDINLFGDARIRYSGSPWVMQHVQGAGIVDQLR